MFTVNDYNLVTPIPKNDSNHTNSESENTREVVAFYSEQDAQEFVDYLTSNSRGKFTADATPYMGRQGSDMVVVDIESEEALKFQTNEEGSFLEVGGEAIKVPDDMAQTMLAVGDKELGELQEGNYDESLMEKAQTQRSWGIKAKSLQDQINPCNDFEVGQPIKMSPESFESLKSILKNTKEHYGLKSNTDIETALIKYAAENGMLDDGVLDADEALKLEVFSESDEFIKFYARNPSTDSAKEQFSSNVSDMLMDEEVSSSDIEKMAADEELSIDDRAVASILSQDEDLFKEIDASSEGIINGTITVDDIKAYREQVLNPEKETQATLIKAWMNGKESVKLSDLATRANSKDISQYEKELLDNVIEEYSMGGGLDSKVSIPGDLIVKTVDKFVESKVRDSIADFIKRHSGDDNQLTYGELYELGKSGELSNSDELIVNTLLSDDELMFSISDTVKESDEIIFSDKDAEAINQLNEISSNDKPEKELTEQQAFYVDNREHFKTLTSHFTEWAKRWGGDDKISVKDLKKLVKDKDLPENQKKAAQFLLDNEKLLSSIDGANSKDKENNKFSAKELTNWMVENSIMDDVFSSRHSSEINKLDKHWHEISGGKDKLHVVNHLKEVVKNPKDKDGKPEYSEGAVESARFLLDNPDYMFYLDKVGMGGGNSDANLHYDSFRKLADGVITQDYGQFKEGNCWSLAGFDALSRTKDGSQAILNAISIKENGDYAVTFPGDPEQKEYTVSKEELKKSTFIQKDGDPEMNALNIALNKFVKDNPGFLGMADDIGKGGISTRIFELFSGQSNTIKEKDDLKDWIRNKDNADGVNNHEIGGVLSGHPTSDGAIGKSDVNHAFVVTDIDAENKTVSYINPWNGSDEKSMSLEEFDRHVDEGNIYRLGTTQSMNDHDT